MSGKPPVAQARRPGRAIALLPLLALVCLSTPATGAVFAEPSGRLCATREENKVCSEPTSSAVDTDALKNLQQSATGELVRFNALGVQNDLYQEFASVASGMGVTNSSSTYVVLEQGVVFGHRQIVESMATYLPAPGPLDNTLRYARGKDSVVLGLGASSGSPFSMRRNAVYAQAAGPDGGRRGVRDWPAFFGPLTDRTDAPREAEVEFVGKVDIRAGDGSPVMVGPIGRMGRIVWGGCEITLKLRTSDGSLTTRGATCVDPQTQAVISFRLAPVFFTASRLAGHTGSEAGFEIDGPSGGLISVRGVERTSVRANSSTIVGAVYGRGAAGLAVVGSSAQGTFQIVAKRP